MPCGGRYPRTANDDARRTLVPRTSATPTVCRTCDFIEADGGCTLLRDLTPTAAATLLTKGRCQPRDALAARLRRDWPWLTAQQIEELEG